MGDESVRSTLNLWGFATILVLAVTIVIISWLAMDRFATAADVVAVLAAIVGPLAGIGAAAFGIKLGADAKSDAANAIGDRDRTREKAVDLADELDRLVAPDGHNVRAGGESRSVSVAAIGDIGQKMRDLGA